MKTEIAASPGAGEAPASKVGDNTRDESRPTRHRLPDERRAIVHHFSVGGHEGYLMVGLYPDGKPGEIFIRMAKAGSTIAGMMDSFGIAVSLALQYGVPLKWQARHLRGNRKDRIMRRKVELGRISSGHGLNSFALFGWQVQSLVVTKGGAQCHSKNLEMSLGCRNWRNA